MELTFSNNLFLGKEELNHFKNSLSVKGYRRVFKQLVKDYGVVKASSDTNFDALRIISGTNNGDLSLNAGNAIDSNVDVIEIEANLIDVAAIAVASDNVLRYVVIEYASTDIQDGTVSITSSGAVTGIGTKFTEILRGLPNFPSVVTFNGSANAQEYKVASITDNNNMQLNISGSVIVAESNKTFNVSGTFTPGTVQAPADKFPMKRDGYTLSLQATDAVAANMQFLLASVQNDGAVTTITDLRESKNVFSIGASGSSDASITTTSNVVGLDSIHYANSKAPSDKDIMNITWSVNVANGNWTYNSATQQITATVAAGGSISSILDLTSGDLDGWYVLEESTGQLTKILSSVVSGTLILNMDFANTVTTGTSIKIVPSATLIEFETTTSVAHPIANKRYIYPITDGTAQLDVVAGQTYITKWRHIKGDSTTSWVNVNDGDYFPYTDFDADGNQTSSTPTAYVTATGVLAPLNALNHEDDKMSRTLANTISGVNDLTGELNIISNLDLNYTILSIAATQTGYNNIKTHYKVNSTAASGFTGFANKDNGRTVIISNSYLSVASLTLTHEDVAEGTASNRMTLPFQQDLIIPLGGYVILTYNSETSRWNLLSSSFLINSPWLNVPLTPTYTGINTAGVLSTGSSVNIKIIGNVAYVEVKIILDTTASPTIELDIITINITPALPTGVFILNVSNYALDVQANTSGSHTGNKYRPAKGRTSGANTIRAISTPLNFGYDASRWLPDGNSINVTGMLTIPLTS